MGLFDFLKGSKDESSALRDRLFDLVARGDRAALLALCRERKDAIVAAIPAWQKPPQSVRSDPAALQKYATGLITVARLLAEQLSEPAPLRLLVGKEEDNPILHWQRALEQAAKLKEEMRFQEAERLLISALDRAKGLRGEACDKLLPVTLGWIAQCCFQQGRAREAAEQMAQACQLAEAHGDASGVLSCLAHLYEMHRWLGEGAQAAAYAERLADCCEVQGNAGNATAMRRAAKIVREGEPPCRVVVRIGEVSYDLDTLPPVIDGKVEFVFYRNRMTLDPALEALRKGREQGAKGNFDASLVCFREAARLDPYDPDAPYLEGLSLLHLRRHAEAIGCLEHAEQLAPGWFHARSDHWLARQLAGGTIEHGTFLAIRVAEDASLSAENKLDLLDGAIQKAPRVARLHELRGHTLHAMGRAAEAATACHEGLACAEEPAVKTRLLLNLALCVPDEAERRDLLRQARDLNGDLVASAMASVALRTRA